MSEFQESQPAVHKVRNVMELQINKIVFIDRKCL